MQNLHREQKQMQREVINRVQSGNGNNKSTEKILKDLVSIQRQYRK